MIDQYTRAIIKNIATRIDLLRTEKNLPRALANFARYVDKCGEVYEINKSLGSYEPRDFVF